MTKDLSEARKGELSVKAGDGFELVEGAAGMTEATAADHRDTGAGNAGGGAVREARGGDDGCNEQGGFVADAAGRVLVDGEGLERRGVEGLAGEAHGGGEGGKLAGAETVLVDGHQKRTELGVGDSGRLGSG